MCEPTSPVSHNSQMDAQSFLVLCGTLWGVKGLTVTQNTNTHVNTQRHVQLTQEKLAYTQTHGSAHIQYIAIALFTKFNNLHTHTHTHWWTHTRTAFLLADSVTSLRGLSALCQSDSLPSSSKLYNTPGIGMHSYCAPLWESVGFVCGCVCVCVFVCKWFHPFLLCEHTGISLSSPTVSWNLN